MQYFDIQMNVACQGKISGGGGECVTLHHVKEIQDWFELCRCTGGGKTHLDKYMMNSVLC